MKKEESLDMTYGEFTSWVKHLQDKFRCPALYVQATKDGDYLALTVEPAESRALQGEILSQTFTLPKDGRKLRLKQMNREYDETMEDDEFMDDLGLRDDESLSRYWVDGIGGVNVETGEIQDPVRRRGRPRGSKNKPKLQIAQ